jgi:hypothetical protein
MPFHGLRCARGAFVMRVLNCFAPSSNKNDIADSPRYWTIGLFIFSAWVLFSNLGVVALIESDEGRNAEIAREILLLRDWVTPHYDFIARLDKPILFFDLVALSYKVFGISEWSARLPSALTAFGCLSLTYFFSGSLFGRWAALWSALILLTSLEFFALSRIVILDMLLTFFLTLALCCFFLGQRGVDQGKGKMSFLLMYVAMGAATLVKGPIGVMLPAGDCFLSGFYEAVDACASHGDSFGNIDFSPHGGPVVHSGRVSQSRVPAPFSLGGKRSPLCYQAIQAQGVLVLFHHDSECGIFTMDRYAADNDR